MDDHLVLTPYIGLQATSGIVSKQVPINTIFMYRIYVKVSISRMLIRIKVVPVSDSDTQERETAHKQNEKVIIKAPNQSPIQRYTKC